MDVQRIRKAASSMIRARMSVKSRWLPSTPDPLYSAVAPAKTKAETPRQQAPQAPVAPPPQEGAVAVPPPYAPGAVPPRKRIRGSPRAKKGNGSMLRSFSIPRDVANRMIGFVRDQNVNASAWVAGLIDADLRARGY